MILASKRPSRGTDEKIRYLAKFHTRIVQNKIVLKWVIWTQFQMGGRGGGVGHVNFQEFECPEWLPGGNIEALN